MLSQSKLYSRFSFFILVVCLWGFGSVTARARDTVPSPFCMEGERYYPDGQIVHLGSRYFRICQGKFAFPPRNEKPYVRISRQSHVDAAMQASFPSMRYNGHIVKRPYPPGVRPYPFYSANVGTVDLSGAEYSVFVSEKDKDRFEDGVKKGNLSYISLLVFSGSETANLPEHYLFCVGDPTAKPNIRYSCRLNIRYLPGDNLFIDYLFNYSKSYPGTPFDFESLPHRVRGVLFAAQQLDVTDTIQELGHVPLAARNK